MDALSSYVNAVLEDTTVFISGNVRTSALAVIIATSLFCSVLATVGQLLTENQSRKLVSRKREKEKCQRLERQFPPAVLAPPLKNGFEFNAQTWRWKQAYTFRKNAMFKRKVLKAFAASNSKDKGKKPDAHLLPELMLQTQYVIDLSLNYLLVCPKRLGYQGAHIKYLDLSRNMIRVIPEEIALLKGLEYLEVSNNQLSQLPESIGLLYNLKYIDVHQNNLEYLPDSIGCLAELKELNIRNNELKELPASLGLLHNLLDIYAGNNQLENIPEELFNLQSLEVLDISKNKIEELPSDIGALQKLVLLDVSGCQLSNLPIQLLKCVSLSHLRANNNHISELPDQLGAIQSLTSLEIKNNKLRYLPASLANRWFNTIKVSGNPMYRSTRKIFEDSPSCNKSKFTSLVELTNRTIASNGYQNVQYLPHLYRNVLLEEKVCAGCNRRIFNHYSRRIQPKPFGGQVYAASVYYCSPHLHRKCPELRKDVCDQ